MVSLKSILLVEDSPEDAELVLHALRSFNLVNKIVHVQDGVEALDYLYRREEFASLPEEQPAVILLDLKLPKLNGLQVLRDIKNNPKLRLISVVVMTSSREDQDILNSYKLGVNAYVVKPVRFHEFVDAVKQVGAFWAMLNEAPPVTLPVPAER